MFSIRDQESHNITRSVVRLGQRMGGWTVTPGYNQSFAVISNRTTSSTSIRLHKSHIGYRVRRATITDVEAILA